MNESTGWLVIAIIVAFFFWWFFVRKDKSRVIPEDIKRQVLARFNGECACCIERDVIDFHHRKEFADGGGNTFENLVALCPNHHALITRNGGKQ